LHNRKTRSLAKLYKTVEERTPVRLTRQVIRVLDDDRHGQG
jgi:hypothetical protein